VPCDRAHGKEVGAAAAASASFAVCPVLWHTAKSFAVCLIMWHTAKMFSVLQLYLNEPHLIKIKLIENTLHILHI